jgi:hypothetical protein
VTAVVVCGPTGPLSVHTPDVCYAGAGYEAKGPPSPFTLRLTDPDREAEFRTQTFDKDGTDKRGELRLFWSWSAGGSWQAPANPRWTFARHAALYKLYVLRETTANDRTPPEDDACVKFMKVFLPELEHALGSH